MLVNQRFTSIPFISSVREAILEALGKGPVDGAHLLSKVTLRSPVSKQGLYKALRELIQEEVILKEGKIFTLNKVWLSRLKDYIKTSEQNLGVILPFHEKLITGRKVITFTDLEMLNVYWGHLFLALTEHFPDKPIFFYNHHSWYMYDRPYSETFLYKTSLVKNQRIMITIGNNTYSAKSFKREYSKLNIRININEKLNIPITDHLCVVGDYLIITKYDQKTMKAIDVLFKNVVVFTERDVSELKKILLSSKKAKMVIIKSKQKAMLWKRRLSKDFVIKKNDL